MKQFSLLKRHRYDFYIELLVKGKPSLPIVKSILLEPISTHKFKIDLDGPSSLEKGVVQISYMPDFCSIQLSNDDRLMERSVVHDFGFKIDLKNIENLNSHLKKQFKKNANSIRSYVRRLESCFDIEYKFFFGDIEKEHYEELLSVSKRMIIKRFDKKKEKSVQLKNWELVEKHAYELVKSKRACIFVIYENGIPINIAINYINGKIYFGYISSFDIDYSKFSLGHINIYKQLEWCFENGYDVFDLGGGTMDYKKRWSNCSYNNRKYFYCNKNSFLDKGYLQLLLIFNKIKLFLIEKRFHLLIKKYKKRIRKIIRRKKKLLNVLTKEEIKVLDGYKEIGISEGALSKFKKNIHDFLYSNQEHISNIKIYQSNDHKSILVKGTHKIEKMWLC